MKTRFLDFIKNYETFEEWFDIFINQVHNLGYNGSIMSETFMEDWENEKCPYEVAEEFVQEMNEKIKLNIEVGDELRGGRFKNKKIIVKKIGKDDENQPTVNGKTILKYKIVKDLPKNKK
ncbi:MAG: hypothetical protein HPY57_16090 [Ignavibacteria bacterium]|nr:hypothetical protein [Ignavibacteria bacterium]